MCIGYSGPEKIQRNTVGYVGPLHALINQFINMINVNPMLCNLYLRDRDSLADVRYPKTDRFVENRDFTQPE